MSITPKIWYSLKGGQPEDDHVGLYNKEDFFWTDLLEQNYLTIKKEVEQYIHRNEESIKPYFNKDLVTKDKSWKTFSFFLWLWKVKKNIKQCPETNKILKQIPHIVSASISILEPDVQIKRHRGDTNAVVRAHLALVAPVQLPDCGFKVNEQEASWEEGKVIVFNNAAIHTAWNHSNKRRYVLLIDVMRPEFAKKKYTVSCMVLGGLVMQSIFQHLPFFKKLPRFCNAVIFFFHAGLINITLRVRNTFNI